MRYRNPTDRGLDFYLRGHHHKVAAGGTCEIPIELEFALTSRGLPLERDPVDGDTEDEGPELPPAWKGAALPPPGSTARIWLARALDANAEATRERERAQAAEESADAAEQVIDTLRADLEEACRQRDEALTLVDAAGAAKAEDEAAPPADEPGATRSEETKTSPPAETDATGSSTRKNRK